jgi:hypothetical protein
MPIASHTDARPRYRPQPARPDREPRRKARRGPLAWLAALRTHPPSCARHTRPGSDSHGSVGRTEERRRSPSATAVRVVAAGDALIARPWTKRLIERLARDP